MTYKLYVLTFALLFQCHMQFIRTAQTIRKINRDITNYYNTPQATITTKDLLANSINNTVKQADPVPVAYEETRQPEKQNFVYDSRSTAKTYSNINFDNVNLRNRSRFISDEQNGNYYSTQVSRGTSFNTPYIRKVESEIVPVKSNPGIRREEFVHLPNQVEKQPEREQNRIIQKPKVVKTNFVQVPHENEWMNILKPGTEVAHYQETMREDEILNKINERLKRLEEMENEKRKENKRKIEKEAERQEQIEKKEREEREREEREKAEKKREERKKRKREERKKREREEKKKREREEKKKREKANDVVKPKTKPKSTSNAELSALNLENSGIDMSKLQEMSDEELTALLSSLSGGAGNLPNIASTSSGTIAQPPKVDTFDDFGPSIPSKPKNNLNKLNRPTEASKANAMNDDAFAMFGDPSQVKPKINTQQQPPQAPKNDPFAGFSAPPQQQTPQAPKNDPFAGFNAPPQQPTPQAPKNDPFAGFNAPPQQPNTNIPAQNGFNNQMPPSMPQNTPSISQQPSPPNFPQNQNNFGAQPNQNAFGAQPNQNNFGAQPNQQNQMNNQNTFGNMNQNNMNGMPQQNNFNNMPNQNSFNNMPQQNSFNQMPNQNNFQNNQMQNNFNQPPNQAFGNNNQMGPQQDDGFGDFDLDLPTVDAFVQQNGDLYGQGGGSQMQQPSFNQQQPSFNQSFNQQQPNFNQPFNQQQNSFNQPFNQQQPSFNQPYNQQQNFNEPSFGAQPFNPYSNTPPPGYENGGFPQAPPPGYENGGFPQGSSSGASSKNTGPSTFISPEEQKLIDQFNTQFNF